MHIGDMIYEKNKAIWMNIREMEEQDRPREKLERKGPESLSDLELVMLLVSSGTLDRSVNEISDELLDLLDRDEDPDLDRICAIRGMGKAKGTTVLAALELGRRRLRKMGVGATISSPGDIYREVRHYASRHQEQFIVLVLNGAHEVLNIFVATVGLVNKTLVHPREVFSDAIARRATAIAIAHNHPSGNLDPSEDDINVTRRIKAAGEILGIKVLDHLVFTDKGYYSFLEHSLEAYAGMVGKLQMSSMPNRPDSWMSCGTSRRAPRSSLIVSETKIPVMSLPRRSRVESIVPRKLERVRSESLIERSLALSELKSPSPSWHCEKTVFLMEEEENIAQVEWHDVNVHSFSCASTKDAPLREQPAKRTLVRCALEKSAWDSSHSSKSVSTMDVPQSSVDEKSTRVKVHAQTVRPLRS